MSPLVEQLFETARCLPIEERHQLLEALIELEEHPPIPQLTGEEYLKEIQRRSTESNPATWSTWSEVKKRVFAKHGITE